MNIDKRIQALATRHKGMAELTHHDIQDHLKATRQDAENIRALCQIVEIRAQRLSQIEGQR